MPELSTEQKLMLVKPLPAAAISPHPTKKNMSSIKPIYIVERLNEVFGPGVWKLETNLVPINGAGETIIAITRTTAANKERTEYSCVVKTRLIVESYSICYECIAGSTNDDMGDAAKGGTSDGLSKICSWMGIGMDVYKGDQEKAEARWLVRIKPVIKSAIADLADCKSVDDLIKLREELPPFILENAEFKTAGTARYHELNTEAHKPALAEAEPQNALAEGKEPETTQSQAQEPAIEAQVVPVKPGSLGTEIKDGNGMVVDIAKLIREASTVDKVNSIRSSLIKKQDEGYDVKDHINTLHDKANRELNLIFIDKDKRFSIFQAKEDAKGVNVLDADGKLVDIGAKIALANTIPAIDSLLDELRKYNLEGYDMGSWVKALHDRATNTLGFRYNSTQKKYYIDVTKGITAPVPA